SGGRWGLIAGMIAVLGAGTTGGLAAAVLAASGDTVPAFVQLRAHRALRQLPRKLTEGITAGLLGGGLTGLIVGVTLTLARGLPAGATGGGTAGLAVLLAVAFARTLDVWLAAPADTVRAADPTVVLRADRYATLAQGMAGGLAFGLAFGI